jgi:hypothetical protein
LFNDSVGERRQPIQILRPICEGDHIASRLRAALLIAGDRSRGEEGFVMLNSVLRNYRTNPHEFDSWIRANAVLGAILAIGIVAMALGGLYFPGPADGVAELSSVAAPN